MHDPNVPLIDLENAFNDESQLKLLDSACRDHGFFLLKNHGMQQEIDKMWSMSEWFFLKRELKNSNCCVPKKYRLVTTIGNLQNKRET